MDILDKVEVAGRGGGFHMQPFQDLEVELTLIELTLVLSNQLNPLTGIEVAVVTSFPACSPSLIPSLLPSFIHIYIFFDGTVNCVTKCWGGAWE